MTTNAHEELVNSAAKLNLELGEGGAMTAADIYRGVQAVRDAAGLKLAVTDLNIIWILERDFRWPGRYEKRGGCTEAQARYFLTAAEIAGAVTVTRRIAAGLPATVKPS